MCFERFLVGNRVFLNKIVTIFALFAFFDQKPMFVPESRIFFDNTNSCFSLFKYSLSFTTLNANAKDFSCKISVISFQF